MLALSGYQPQTVSVRPEAQGANAAPRLAPNPVQVSLQGKARIERIPPWAPGAPWNEEPSCCRVENWSHAISAGQQTP
jgi:hypothetical protein